jgi:hypothetical protein
MQERFSQKDADPLFALMYAILKQSTTANYQLQWGLIQTNAYILLQWV